ncbi:purple acid phosphatase 21 [Eutrema salsugineum]|uniref:purple acid phosphatase 21 n=1 Tax=Eutrema salsugineum TaxID=72664 RepID=UPI000CED2E5D|nr:purple acid phosphatase 21 [Eutrema salsugineum]
MKIFGLFLSFTLFFLSPFASQANNRGSKFTRPPPRPDFIVSNDRPKSHPQQVHVSLAGKDHMRVTYTTDDMNVASMVEYGKHPKVYDRKTAGEFTSYRHFFYSSGKIHHVKIGPLQPNTIYYYRCGGHGEEFSFKTPPSTFPIEFAVAGDLGQSDWTVRTLAQINKRNFDVFLLPGDLSYADSHQPLWDSFGRLMETLASTRPWMVTEGNHEIESYPIVEEHISFKAYNARWLMPHVESLSHSNLYYSFDTAGVHTVMLGSYTHFDSRSDQYRWLQADLKKVDRKTTPWLVVVMHTPWYSTNKAHEGEGESMRKAMERLFFLSHVDIVFAGHIHTYERFRPVYKNKANQCGPMYITIGDGGNREGLAYSFYKPRSRLSAFRESSFGHGRLRIINEKRAHWSWHRNQDNFSVIADQVWFDSPRTLSHCIRNRSRNEL